METFVSVAAIYLDHYLCRSPQRVTKNTLRCGEKKKVFVTEKEEVHGFAASQVISALLR